MEDLREENRQLKDQNLKLETEVAKTKKERAALATELEQVKANFKQHLQNKHTDSGGGGGGGEGGAALERALAQVKAELEEKQKECDAQKKDLEMRLGDSRQFKDLKALVKKKSDEVRELREQLAKLGGGKQEANSG